MNKHKENFKTRAVFDLSLTAEIYDREVQALNKTMFINDFFSKVEKVGSDGRPVTNNQHLDQIYSALNSAEDRKIMLGGEEVSSKIFNDAGLTIEDRNCIKTWHLHGAIGDYVAYNSHTWTRRINIGISNHKFFQDIILNGPSKICLFHSLLLCRNNISG